MKWKIPPKIKIYEALGCIGDKRIEIDGNEAKVYSSTRAKFYRVQYDGENSIMSNDNGSYYKDYLGYPSIAFLMLKGKISFDPKVAEALRDIAWKNVNIRFKSDYKKTEDWVMKIMREREFKLERLKKEIDSIFEQVKALKLEMFGEKTKPPEGY